MSTATPWAGRVARRVLLAPVSARTWAELAYSVLGVPLGLLGLVFVLVTLVVGTALAVTFLGVPVIALGVLGARRIGALHRKLARGLLGLAVDRPPARRRLPGLLGWIGSTLGDSSGWRAIAYLVVKLPLSAVTLGVAAGFWVYGLFLLSYPVLWRHVLGSNQLRLGSISLDTLPWLLLCALVGLVLLLLAPWVVHGMLGAERLLVRGLLGPSALSERVRDLEATRAHAVADSASALRRIERDLHDGAQARLVTVAMRLGQAKEQLGDEEHEPDVPRARQLVDTAHRDVKEALNELRDLARGIHPPALDNGLDAALASLVTRSAIPVRLEVEVPTRPSPAIETIAYFCAAELLTNVAKHSGGSHATVSITREDDALCLRVADDGIGGARLRSHGGLAGLRDRVRTVDGRLEITSPPGGPTIVAIDLPARPEPGGPAFG